MGSHLWVLHIELLVVDSESFELHDSVERLTLAPELVLTKFHSGTLPRELPVPNLESLSLDLHLSRETQSLLRMDTSQSCMIYEIRPNKEARFLCMTKLTWSARFPTLLRND